MGGYGPPLRPWPAAVDAAARLGEELAFDLQLIAPALPPFPVPAGHGDEMAYLRELTHAGARRRYGPRGPDTEQAYRVVEHELAIIEQLGYATVAHFDVAPVPGAEA